MKQRDDETVGRRIHRLRTGLGLTQRELAEPRYTPGYISAVESDRRTPSAEALQHFALRLGLGVGELATGRSSDHVVEQELVLLEAAVAGDRARLALAAVGPPRLRARAIIDLAVLTEDLEQAAELYARAGVLLAGEPPHLTVEASAGRAVCLRRSGEFRYARHLLRTVRDELHGSGHPDPAALFFVDAHLAACDVQVGDDGSTAAVEALALAMRSPELVRELNLRLARTLVRDGRFDDATLAVAQARAAHRQLGLRPELALCHQARAHVRRDAGDLAGAVTDLDEARTILAAEGRRPEAADVATELAGVHRLLGHAASARALLADVLAEGEAESRVAARAHRQLGLLAADEGELGTAEVRLNTAARVFERTGPRHDLARTLLDLADLMAVRGNAGDAASVLSEGLRTIERMTRALTE
ncbi:helix-turn-helix transcriptional regulator [Amycolatopsis sp. H20-H5]|uniref:helix-turn-helix transcriptional regulator n=1 Tax=Amycolatopsis sp. H20-H5 TaxID=3046309 RepID=UPI002DBE5BB3|nr:helix-turn-helix transcriptional regulator [Amycolatopsis sp. H20-H5]MEC3976427.1 helix-turn-helix transcriptional regulator [Amycolatopsis sp. H20-H5]